MFKIINTQNELVVYLQSLSNGIPEREVGCLRHPGASTIGSQLLDGDCSHGWQILATHR